MHPFLDGCPFAAARRLFSNAAVASFYLFSPPLLSPLISYLSLFDLCYLEVPLDGPSFPDSLLYALLRGSADSPGRAAGFLPHAGNRLQCLLDRARRAFVRPFGKGDFCRVCHGRRDFEFERHFHHSPQDHVARWILKLACSVPPQVSA